jgi:predicted RNA-binding Zn-ribbon protein involved in translation (DUF1610 family)
MTPSDEQPRCQECGARLSPATTDAGHDTCPECREADPSVLGYTPWRQEADLYADPGFRDDLEF